LKVFFVLSDIVFEFTARQDRLIIDIRKRSISAAKTAKYPEENDGIKRNKTNAIKKGIFSFSAPRYDRHFLP
jgi:hypothetical protein